MKSVAGVAARTVARTTAVRTATATRCLGTVLPGHPDPALVKKQTDFVLSREESQVRPLCTHVYMYLYILYIPCGCPLPFVPTGTSQFGALLRTVLLWNVPVLDWYSIVVSIGCIASLNTHPSNHSPLLLHFPLSLQFPCMVSSSFFFFFLLGNDTCVLVNYEYVVRTRKASVQCLGTYWTARYHWSG